jgi:hypothetical protein
MRVMSAKTNGKAITAWSRSSPRPIRSAALLGDIVNGFGPDSRSIMGGDVARANHADADAVGMQQSAQREAIIQDCGFARAISGSGMKPALELTMAICPRSRTIIHQ